MDEEEPDSSLDFSDIDVSSAIRYMEENGVGRLQLSIESMNITDADLAPAEARLVLLERKRPCFTEHETPSPYGLMGVFSILPVGDDD